LQTGNNAGMRYSEEEIAAEEEKLGAKLPDTLRERYLQEMPESVREMMGEFFPEEILVPTVRGSGRGAQGRRVPVVATRRAGGGARRDRHRLVRRVGGLAQGRSVLNGDRE
jgi:hypothetical protein